jgi:Tfp pilus assembly protein PilF
MTRRPAVALLAVLLASPAFADVVHLKDGGKLEGTIKRDAGGWLVTDAAGKVTKVVDADVQLIQKVSTQSPNELGASKLTSLRRAIESSADPEQAIAKLTKFIDENKSAPAAVAEAEKDLATWKDRRDRKLVKVGGNWVTKEEQASLMEKLVSNVDRARNLLKEGRLRDADAEINALLQLDPNNPSGLYLRGVLALKQDKVADARKAFDRLRELVPDHGPTLNNLGVLLHRQRQTQGALAMYDLAMQAMPNHRIILDNVAEALHALSEKEKTATNAKKAASRFAEQDQVLQQQLLKEDLHRWGATYVTTKQFEEVQRAQEKIKDKLDSLKADYDKLTDRLNEIDGQIEANHAQLRRINADRTITDPSGRQIQLQPPSIYYELRRENDKLESEAARLVDQQKTFQARAAKIQQEMPVPGYTNVHRFIDVEGTPLVVPSGTKAEKRPEK